MAGLIRVVLLVVSVAWSSSAGWAQNLPPVLAQAAESPAVSIAPAPEEAAGASRTGNWFRDNVTLSAGIKIWLAKWQVPTQGQGSVLQSSTNFSPMIGPTVTAAAKLRDSVWLNSMFANFTWLSSNGFELQPNRVPVPGGAADVAGDAKRRDYTISGGITIYKGLGIFAGYYNTQQRFSLNATAVPPLPAATATGSGDFRIRGPLIGVFGSAPLDERVGIYGNMAFGLLNYQAGPASGLFTASGTQAWSSEVGVNIAGPEFGKFGTVFQVGFRAQVISINTPNPLTLPGDQHRNDITWGPTFAFMGTF